MYYIFDRERSWTDVRLGPYRSWFLLTNVKQYRLKCTSYENKFETLLHVCNSISEVSKQVIIIPFGSKDNGTKKFDEMDNILEYLTNNGLSKVDFSASSRKNPNGGKRINVLDAEKNEKMRKFKAGETKYMIATTMDRGINIVDCTHVILFMGRNFQYLTQRCNNTDQRSRCFVWRQECFCFSGFKSLEAMVWFALGCNKCPSSQHTDIYALSTHETHGATCLVHLIHTRFLHLVLYSDS